MKKILSLLFICFIVFCVGCGKKLETYTKINYEDYKQKLSNEESFPLVIGSATCSACGIYEGTMEMFIEKHQVEVFFIDIADLGSDERTELDSQINYDGTPTTVFFKKGKIDSYYNRIDGAVGLSTVEDHFRNNNYID